MRFKSLLGLLAIGGAVAYAQKKRTGDLSLNGFKNSFRSIADSVRSKLGDLGATTGTNATASPSTGDDYSSSTGYSSRDSVSSGHGSTDYRSGSVGSSTVGSSGIGSSGIGSSGSGSSGDGFGTNRKL